MSRKTPNELSLAIDFFFHENEQAIVAAGMLYVDLQSKKHRVIHYVLVSLTLAGVGCVLVGFLGKIPLAGLMLATSVTLILAMWVIPWSERRRQGRRVDALESAGKLEEGRPRELAEFVRWFNGPSDAGGRPGVDSES